MKDIIKALKLPNELTNTFASKTVKTIRIAIWILFCIPFFLLINDLHQCISFETEVMQDPTWFTLVWFILSIIYFYMGCWYNSWISLCYPEEDYEFR